MMPRDHDREQETAPAPPAPAPATTSLPAPVGGVMSPAAVLALQASAGNHAVSRALLQRSILGDIGNAIGDALDMRTGEAQLDAQEELEDFRNTPLTPLEDYEPTSGIGRFDVAGDMAAGTLTITLKIGYDFVNGTPGRVSAGFRPEEFRWTAAEKAAWKARYQREVSAMWSAQFPIRSTKPHWDTMVVDTTVRVIEDAKDPHFKMTVAKYPEDAGMVQSSICPPGYHHNASGNCSPNAAGDSSGTAQMDSNDMRPEQKLDWGNAVTEIPFTEGSATLTSAATTALSPIITELSGHADKHVELTGHSSSTHKRGVTAAQGAIDNMDLARARTAAVRAALIAGGVTAEQILVRNVGQAGAAADASWCRVDAQVGSQQTQNPALHETGHMLGSDDEYTTTGSPAGSAVGTRYDAMIRNQTGDSVTTNDSEDAMSLGSTVRRWNYAAFLEAFKVMTDITEWEL